MAVAKVLEITSSSKESIEAAIRDGIAKAAETVQGIQEAWVQGTKAVVCDNNVTEWRVTLKITFIVS
jgi:flavin-binding protein dodecin